MATRIAVVQEPQTENLDTIVQRRVLAQVAAILTELQKHDEETEFSLNIQVENFKREIVQDAIARHKNVSAACRVLGLSRTVCYRILGGRPSKLQEAK